MNKINEGETILDTDTAANEYFKSLEKFSILCNRLIDSGFQYLTVNLCHELYRFLYPIEPYTSFDNNNPVKFISNHIEKLIKLGNTFSDVIQPYPLDLKSSKILNEGTEFLEKETSDLYSSLWKEFSDSTLSEESYKLLNLRLSDQIIKENIMNKKILDIGCGSGRFSLALARLGAKQVTAVDVQKKSYEKAEKVALKLKLNIVFKEENVLKLSFADNMFDFVFCNGVLHHTHSIQQGLTELNRVLIPSGKAFFYIYAANGIFWETRKTLRKIFKKIPIRYTQSILSSMGMPPNRFIFCDTWYVPVETHTTIVHVEKMMDEAGFHYEKIIGKNKYDLDKAINDNIKGANLMWGDGEHRYILDKI